MAGGDVMADREDQLRSETPNCERSDMHWDDAPTDGVYWDPARREHVVVIGVPVAEVRTIASLAYSDLAQEKLLAWADEAESLDSNVAWVRFGFDHITTTED